MRGIFSNWHLNEGAWVVAPLALWIAAYLTWALVLSLRRKRLLGVFSAAREMGAGWKFSFLAAVGWMLVWAVWLTIESGGT